MQREHDVVGVLLHRVVHRRGEVGLRAVVVDAQAAAHVEVLQRRAQLAQLDVEAARLAQRVLDAADGGDLAAEVEVQQLEAVEQVVARAGSRSPRPSRAATGRTSSGRRPTPPTCPRRAADSLTRMPMRGRTPILLGDLGDQRQLGRLLDDEDDRAAQLRGEQRGLDVLLVLVAVADDQRLLVVEQRHDREQLGLASRPRGRSGTAGRTRRSPRPRSGAG